MASDSGEDFQLSQTYVGRRQCLVTYGLANLGKFPIRQSFGQAIASCFHNTSKIVVDYCESCLKEYENTSGQRYYMCIKLSGSKRWNFVNLIKSLNRQDMNWCYTFLKIMNIIILLTSIFRRQTKMFLKVLVILTFKKLAHNEI